MELIPNTTVHGCTVQSAEDLPEIEGRAYILRHDVSGARICYLANDDANKAFSISFRTIPSDDSGVFHILEHSVLCGSKRFPVKEPFVNLLKTSMNTFLNAMTFPDKTMYPVASTNEQDLFNLADVYLDAVFHPAFYKKPTVFQQEGWHLEPADTESGLVFNGVVFNEMKGALSDAETMLYLCLQQTLFPQNAYRFESGGTPEGITQLTYERFLAEHRRYYRTDNSYIVLYGNMDIDRMLAFLDERYLSPVAEEQRLRDAQNPENAAAKPLALAWQKPVCTLGVKRRMETSPENSCAAAGFVVGSTKERIRLFAADLLLDALLGSNEAPLKRALLDADLASDVQAFLADDLAQPFAMIELKDLRPGAGDALLPTLEENVRALLEKGVDRTLLEASLSRAEFTLRERDFRYADGVAHAMGVMAGWLYDEDAALDFVRYEDDLAALREALEGDYYDRLLEELFLSNPHKAEVEIIPAPTDGPDWEAARLSALADSLDDKGRARIAEEARELKAAQERPDTPENLATLPQLSLADIDPLADEPAVQDHTDSEIPYLYHEAGSRGIDYLFQYYRLDDFSYDELADLSLFALLLGKLGTAKHSASEVDTLINGKLGSFDLAFDLVSGLTARPDASDLLSLKLTLSASALHEKSDWLATLPFEIISSTDFSDTVRIKSILMQRKVGMEQAFIAAGHSHAVSRASSYHSPCGLVNQMLSGVDFYKHLCALLQDFEHQAPAFIRKMASFATRIFVDTTPLVSFTGSPEDLPAILAATKHVSGGKGGEGTGRAWDNGADGKLWSSVPKPLVKHEAFIVPGDVCFAATAVSRKSFALSKRPFSGAWVVAAKALSYDFLWNEVRVKGGAYGAGFQARPEGELRFYSYRDPNYDKTLENFRASATWLRSFAPASEELEGYVVSSVAAFDAPVKTRALVRRQDARFLHGETFEDYRRIRQQIIETTVQDLQELGGLLDAALDGDSGSCVFGNRDILSRSNTPETLVTLLKETDE